MKDFHDRSKTPENATSVAELRLSRSRCGDVHQTQSALSHQFSNLEQRLGFRLFVRKSQPLRFTPQENAVATGKPVLPQIHQALQACNEPQQTRLRIAIECHSCIQWLTPALKISIRTGRR